jgi:hypothetical protein
MVSGGRTKIINRRAGHQSVYPQIGIKNQQEDRKKRWIGGMRVTGTEHT